MYLPTGPYLVQAARWPRAGRHILAQFDKDSVIVYQAYRPAIGQFAAKHGYFGGPFSLGRMSWIKPNFLWMMYRAGWATKEGQERILAIRLSRTFFDELLRSAVPSSHDPQRFPSEEAWRNAVASSDVRLQWDPDHDPGGRALERRAIQLGLRGDTLRRYGEREALSITDMTDFVAGQRAFVQGDFGQLQIPGESVYQPEAAAARSAGIDAWSSASGQQES
jgi:hypothetical protein